MKKLIFFSCGWLYRLTFQAIFNFFGNAYWLVRMYTGPRLRRKYAETKLAAMCNMDIEIYQSYLEEHKASYQYDGLTKSGIFRRWPTWTALPIVTAYRNFQGNCQDFAVLARHCFRPHVRVKIMVPLSISKLASGIHYIAYWQIAGVVFSNARVARTNPDSYADARLGKNKYVWLC